VGALQYILGWRYNHRAVCIGWFHKNQLIICPHVKESITVTSDHRLIVIVRFLNLGGEESSNSNGHSVTPVTTPVLSPKISVGELESLDGVGEHVGRGVRM